jgi:hypothetical protein
MQTVESQKAAIRRIVNNRRLLLISVSHNGMQNKSELNLYIKCKYVYWRGNGWNKPQISIQTDKAAFVFSVTL